MFISMLALLFQSSGFANAYEVQDRCKAATRLNTIVAMESIYPSLDWENLLDRGSQDQLSRSPLGSGDDIAIWYGLKSPRREVRRAAWDGTLELTRYYRQFDTLELVVDKDIAVTTRERFSGPTWPAWDQQTQTLRNNSFAICSEFGYVDLGCARALKYLTYYGDSIRAYNDANITIPSAWAEFVSLRVHERAIKSLAKTMIAKIAIAETTGEITSDFFSDLITAYVSQGVTPEKAIEYSWTVAAVYGSRGAPMRGTYSVFYSASQWAATQVVASAMSYLDSFSFQKGYLYSLPKDMNQTTCLTNKPYHFWMPAALMNHLLVKGYNWSDASAATHIMGTLYEFGTSIRRDNNDVYHRDFDSVANDVYRVSFGQRRLALDYSRAARTPSPLDVWMREVFDHARKPAQTGRNYEDALKNDLKRLSIFRTIFGLEAIKP